MNAINRIGQKVICVGPEMIWRSVCPTLEVLPVRGQVYTVTGFEEVDGLPAIHLREIEGFSCECGGFSNAPWLISAFRPVDERKTDISAFTELLNTTKAPERVDA
jgi:hypothetical protein